MRSTLRCQFVLEPEVNWRRQADNTDNTVNTVSSVCKNVKSANVVEIFRLCQAIASNTICPPTTYLRYAFHDFNLIFLRHLSYIYNEQYQF